MLFVHESRAHLAMGDVEHGTRHESAATHLDDMLRLLLQLAQSGEQIFAHLMGIVHQMLLLEDVEHSQGGGTCQMVASEGGAELALHRLEARRDEHARHGEAVAYALGHGDEVGAYAEPLVGKELTAAAVATLYLVADEDGAVAVASLEQTLGKLGCSHIQSAHALDALDDAGSHVALGEFGFPCLQVVEGQEGGMSVGIDGGIVFGDVGHLDGERGAAVEGLAGSEHAGASGLERCQLERVLIGFGARVDKEEAVVVIPAGFAETLGELLLQSVDDRVAVEPQPVELGCHHLHVVWVAVADADDGMATIEVEILLSLVVPDMTATAFDDVHVREGIYIKQIHSRYIYNKM